MTRQLILGGAYTTRHPFGSRFGRAVRSVLIPGRPAARGIHVLHFDRQNGTATLSNTIPAGVNPSWIALHPHLPVAYASNETDNGAITSIALDSPVPALLNSVKTGGSEPCFVNIDHTGRRLYVAHYGSGTVTQFALESDGRVGAHVETLTHTGSSVDARQRGPHPHCVAIAPDNSFAFVPDLGADRIVAYRIDAATGRLTRAHELVTAAGAGPRHFVFDAAQPFAFLINELNTTVTSFRYDAQRGTLTEINSVSTLPHDVAASTAADVQIHPTQRRLYASNRGYDSIAIFDIAPDGQLTLNTIARSGGKTPRGFAIDPAGEFLLVAHQDSDDLVTFRISSDGTLTECSRTTVPVCVCLKFVPR